MRKYMLRAAHTLRSDRGSVAVIVGLFTLGILAAGGLAVDFTRASALQRKLQAANDIAAREGARGKSDAEVAQLVRGQLDSYLRSRGYTSGGNGVSVGVNRAGGVVNVYSTTPYTTLLSPLYSGAKLTIAVRSASNARAFCSAPAPETRWLDTSAACPAGYLGSITYQRQQQRTASCASETAAGATWSGWIDTGAERSRVDTCAPQCVVPPDQQQWGPWRAVACPANYQGSITVQDLQVRSGYCPAATGASAWGGWVNTGTTQEVANTCSPICTPAPAQTQWDNRSTSCPAGQNGTNAWQAEQYRTSYCSGSTLVWNGWVDTGNTRPVTYTCAAPPPPTYHWVYKSSQTYGAFEFNMVQLVNTAKQTGRYCPNDGCVVGHVCPDTTNGRVCSTTGDTCVLSIPLNRAGTFGPEYDLRRYNCQ